MRVSITSTGPDMASQVDPRFGRAGFFIVVDTETGEFSTHDNGRNMNAAHGAGIQSARLVASLKVDAVITGNMGPKAFSALQSANVKIYIGASGSVTQAVEQFKSGQLECADKPNVDGHRV